MVISLLAVSYNIIVPPDKPMVTDSDGGQSLPCEYIIYYVYLDFVRKFCSYVYCDFVLCSVTLMALQ